jgi:hypothetical protein
MRFQRRVQGAGPKFLLKRGAPIVEHFRRVGSEPQIRDANLVAVVIGITASTERPEIQLVEMVEGPVRGAQRVVVWRARRTLRGALLATPFPFCADDKRRNDDRRRAPELRRHVSRA